MKARLVTVRDKIRVVADRWAEQYQRKGARGMVFVNAKTQQVHERLVALDTETALPEDVALIIGNDTWTNLSCDACNARGLDRVVIVGEEPDCESSTARLCETCAFEAFGAFAPKETP